MLVVSELKVIEKDVKPEWNTIQFKFTAGSSDDFNLVQSGGKWQLQTKRGFDYETEKEIKVKVGSKTEMPGIECPTKLSAGASLEIHGCNCATKKGKVQEATKVVVAGKKKGKKKDA